MEEKKKNANFGKRLALSILCFVLAVILTVMSVLAATAQSLLNSINRIEPDDETLSSDQLASILDVTDEFEASFTGEVIVPEDVTQSSSTADHIEVGEHIINILLVGQDRRKGESRRHSDSTILCTINKDTKTLTLTSFMRDMWVYIPYKTEDRHFYERINVAYMYGGFDLLNATLKHNFGVSSDNNVEVDFEGFESIIDSIGGIDINLTAKEAEYLNRRGNWGVEENTGWTLTAGVNHMTGSQALAYSRIRDIGADYARTNRQRTVLTNLVNHAKTLSIGELYNLVKSALPLLTTNMSNAKILGYVTELAPLLPELTIISQRIPADGAYTPANIEHDGYIKNVLTLNEEQLKKNIALLKGTLNDE